MTTSAEVRSVARQFMLFAALAPIMGVLAYTFDGIYIGATWARDMRNLMPTARRSEHNVSNTLSPKRRFDWDYRPPMKKLSSTILLFRTV